MARPKGSGLGHPSVIGNSNSYIAELSEEEAEKIDAEISFERKELARVALAHGHTHYFWGPNKTVWSCVTHRRNNHPEDSVMANITKWGYGTMKNFVETPLIGMDDPRISRQLPATFAKDLREEFYEASRNLLDEFGNPRGTPISIETFIAEKIVKYTNTDSDDKAVALVIALQKYLFKDPSERLKAMNAVEDAKVKNPTTTIMITRKKNPGFPDDDESAT